MECAAFHYTNGSIAFGAQQKCGIQHPISLLIFLNLISRDADSMNWNSLNKKVRKNVTGQKLKPLRQETKLYLQAVNRLV